MMMRSAEVDLCCGGRKNILEVWQGCSCVVVWVILAVVGEHVVREPVEPVEPVGRTGRCVGRVPCRSLTRIK